MKKFILLTILVALAVRGLCGAVASAEALEVRAKAPGFNLADQNGKMHNLTESKGKWVVLAFYPADRTPGCTLENRSIRDSYAKLQKMGVDVYAISVQDSASHAKFCQQEGLTHTLLADITKQTATAYGVLNDRGYASRVSFILDPEGSIALRMNKVNVQTHGEDLITAITELRASANSQPTTGARGLKPLRPKDEAPLFSLPILTGEGSVALSDLRVDKKGVVVMWVSGQCPVTDSYEGRIKSLASEYGSKGIAFVGIASNANESDESLRAHFLKSALGFPVARDISNIIADQYGAAVTPEAFLVDAKGIVRYHGAIDDSTLPSEVKTSYLRAALDSYLADQPIAQDDTKTYGSRIKRVRK